MSGQDDYLSGQNLDLAVILTGHVLVHGPGHQNFQFLTTLGDKGYRIFLETLFTILYVYV